MVWYPIWIQGGSGSWERKIRIQIQGAEINRSGSREWGKTQIWVQGAKKHGPESMKWKITDLFQGRGKNTDQNA